jgi:hypothetical protein
MIGDDKDFCGFSDTFRNGEQNIVHGGLGPEPFQLNIFGCLLLGISFLFI